MRFHNKHDRKNILSNQKIAIIQKANHRSHTLLQFINNELVDRIIRGFDTGNVDEITEKEIYDLIWEKVKEVNKKLTSYKAVKELEIKKGEFEKTSTMKIKRYKELQDNK